MFSIVMCILKYHLEITEKGKVSVEQGCVGVSS